MRSRPPWLQIDEDTAGAPAPSGSSARRHGDLAEVKIRGSALAPTRAFVEAKFGRSGWEKFLEQLSETARAAVGAPNPVGWYPFSAALSGVDALVRLGEGKPNVLRDYAIHNLDYATNIIFRVIFKVECPEFMIKRSDQVWRRFYSVGNMACEASKGYACVRLYDFPHASPNYSRLVLHSMEAILTKAGARVERLSQTRDTNVGDSYSEYEFEWR